jgi:hypothetical protein
MVWDLGEEKVEVVGDGNNIAYHYCVVVLGSKNGWTLLVSFVIGVADRNPSV